MLYCVCNKDWDNPRCCGCWIPYLSQNALQEGNSGEFTVQTVAVVRLPG